MELLISFCNSSLLLIVEIQLGFPGGLMVRISGFRCQGLGSTPGWGTEIMQAAQLQSEKYN